MAAPVTHQPRTYSKPACTPVELLEHLQTKGLIVPNVEVAIRALETIGYYRLLIYFRAFQTLPSKIFRQNVQFDDVVEVYNFDRKLRLLCLNAIDKIEVCLRASINNRVAVEYGPHFYLSCASFDRRLSHEKFLGHAGRTNHDSITHYKRNYQSPTLPPIWALTEGLTFGKLSILFADIILPMRKAIARDFGYDEVILVSWFKCLTDLRNKCAHHNRLWNAHMLVDKPKKARRLGSLLEDQDRFYARAVLIVALLKIIDPQDDWKDQFKSLIDEHSFIDPCDMGFPNEWKNLTFWN